LALDTFVNLADMPIKRLWRRKNHRATGARNAGHADSENADTRADSRIRIAFVIQQVSDEVLRVEEGSLYPALHRLELDGIIDSEWAFRPTIAARNITS